MKRKSGFTLIQTLVAGGLAMMVTFLLAQTSLFSSYTFEKLQNQGFSVNKSRGAFEKLVWDVRNGDRLLAKYPTSGTAVFNASDDNCIIIRQPKYDASNEPIANQFRVIIYRVDSTSVAGQGPRVLRRFQAQINGSTQSTAISEGIVIPNIQSRTITTAINQTFYGDQSTKEYWLLSTPMSPTAEIKNEVLIGGVNRLDDGWASLSGNKITLDKALNYGVVCDATYHSNPATSIDLSGDNGGTSVFLRITVRPQWKTQGGRTKTKDVTYTSRPSLMNRES
jgi:hypothetical protein